MFQNICSKQYFYSINFINITCVNKIHKNTRALSSYLDFLTILEGNKLYNIILFAKHNRILDSQIMQKAVDVVKVGINFRV